MDVTPILAGLNEAQRSAVAAPLGNALVVAGAGSGKTRVLVHRFAWLIAAEGISPQGVLAVTFTNKAATEMRERIEALLSIPARALWVGTFHGIAHRLLRLHWREAGLPQNFQIIDADDQQRLVKRIMRALGVDDSRWPPRQAVWFINGHKDQGLRAKDLAKSDDLFEVTHKQIYENYEQHCNEAGLVDFAELLLRCLECLSANEDFLAHYQCRFGQILVDEFQDTNGLQYQWLILLASSGTPTCTKPAESTKWRSGMKAHIGVDSGSKLIHSVVATAANVHGPEEVGDLLHGMGTRIWGGSAYAGRKSAIRSAASGAKDFARKKGSRHHKLADKERWPIAVDINGYLKSLNLWILRTPKRLSVKLISQTFLRR